MLNGYNETVVFLSEYLSLSNELKSAGVFDCIINKDSPFYINLLRLKDTNIPEFKNSYNKINSFFDELMILLETAKSKSKDDKFFSAALKKFAFRELNSINLGFSESLHGSGFGKKLSYRVISDAYDIVKAGSKQPEIFQLVSLFEPGVAGDRLTDMIASIIIDDIKEYTKRINSILNINSTKYSKLTFNNGFLINPYKKCEILYLPQDILDEFFIARDWSEIDIAIADNMAIRNEMNTLVSEEWCNFSLTRKKKSIYKNIFMNKECCTRVINSYRNESVKNTYDLNSNETYATYHIFSEIKKSGVLDFLIHDANQEKDSKEVAYLVLNAFKDWVENLSGWKEIQDRSTRNREKSIQSMIQLCGNYICKEQNYDFTFEANEGHGPSDIKISRGSIDKTVIEVKLNTNTKYLHGYRSQLPQYSKSEGTNKSIYVFIEIEDYPSRTMNIKKAYEDAKTKYEYTPDLYFIDARKRFSASK